MQSSRSSLFAVVSLLSFTVACARDADAFIESHTRLDCKIQKKCHKAEWVEADYRSVNDCVDQNLADSDIDAFAESCNYDAEAGRECLAGLRRVQRTCDVEAPSKSQREACDEVCVADAGPMVSGGAADDDGGGADDGGGETDNAAACEALVAELECGGIDFSQGIDCGVYAGLGCDVSDYFDCLRDGFACKDGMLDSATWSSAAQECASLAQCS